MNLLLKRAMDLFFAVVGSLLLIPLFLLIACLIKLDSKGPVFFCQERLTRHGRRFQMLKFRSMVVNAEKMELGLFNYAGDPRVTRVGRFLRNTSIDELPQLLNVICGSLSLVGPRPPVTYELGDFDTLSRRYKKRFQVKAGITGLAQVKGRNNILWDKKVEYDNQYIDLFQKQGVLIDIKIIFITILNVFRRESIYEIKADASMDDAEAARLAEEDVIVRAHQADEI